MGFKYFSSRRVAEDTLAELELLSANIFQNEIK